MTTENVQVPFFSVVLPIYNVEKYLERCITSILAQSFDDYEIILVDDGSKDNCPSLCDKWATKDTRIKVIHKKNAGLGMARNSGLEIAKGKYVFFVDSDDYILPNVFSDIYNILQQTKYDMVSFGFNRVDSKNEIVSTHVPNTPKDQYIDKEEIKNVLLADFVARNPYEGHNCNLRISAWNCCIRTSFLKENNLNFVSEREFISEDIYFYIEMFEKLESVFFVKKAYYCYCQNEGSLSYSYRKDRFQKLKDFYIAVEELADQLGYDGEVQFRLKESFIASVMGCLKMEAANCKNVSIKEAYNNVKKIAKDEYLVTAINLYPLEHYGTTWKIFFMAIKKQYFVFLFFILFLQFYIKGV